MMLVRPLVLTLAILFAAQAADAPVAEHKLPPGITWQQGDVAAAFALAKSTNKPLFLYWGATWCPPCNQVKATIFNRQDFIARTRQFVPVYLDGDSPDAQKLGSQFKVVGYPTMILFKPDGSEITRLPGEVEGERYVKALSLALRAARPVKALLGSALKGEALAGADWELLADYSWDTDESQLVPQAQLAATLQQLAERAPAKPERVATRLWLKALASAAVQTPPPTVIDKAKAVASLKQLLADPKRVRANSDILANYAPDIVQFLLPEGLERKQLASAWDKALQTLEADKALATADRLDVLDTRIALVRIASGKSALPDALLKTVRKETTDADKKTSNPFERQSAINSAAHVLSDAGLLNESDTLLQAELKRSRAPYYHMLSLAANAKARGDKMAALDWYEKAYNASEGEATRLQWGATYIAGAIDLAPTDDARIGKAADSVVAEIAKAKNPFYERSRRSVEKIFARLHDWNKDRQHDGIVKRATAQLGDVCGKLPVTDPQRPACNQILDKSKA